MGYKTWIKHLEKNFEETVSWRRHMHQYPELSFEEETTAEFIKSVLEDIGVDELREKVGNGYGMVARIKGAHPGPTIAFRADFDALEITEKANVPFQSKNEGVMHACGHDGHTASILSVARVLSEHRDDLHGDVVFIHQNAEEMLPGGAKSMVEAGALENVDYVFGIHLNSEMPVKQVYYEPEFGSANADFVLVTLKARETNTSSYMPDLLLAATEYLTSSQKIVSRMTDPKKPAVLTFATIETDRSDYTHSPKEIALKATVRTLHQDTRELIEEELSRMAGGITQAFQVDVSVDYKHGYPSIKNHKPEVERSVEKFNEVFASDEVEEIEVGMGGEDFSYFLEEKPGAFFRVGAKFPGDDNPYPHHHPKFVIHEDSLLRSGQVFLALTEEYIGKSNQENRG